MAAGVGKVLVTGASGFIASHIVKQLQCAGYRVRGTVRDLNNDKKVKCLYGLCPEARHQLELVEADLLKPDSWHEAVSSCTHVIHTASPLPVHTVRNENDIIVPAVEGTRAILRACREAGTIQRLVLTSSTAAVTGGIDNRVGDAMFSEDDWTDPLKTRLPYVKSKTLAEKEAWKFLTLEGGSMDLSVINPCVVMGPVLCGNRTASMELLTRLMAWPVAVVPHINMNIVDVRDVAAAHIAAMTKPAAGGHRYIVAGHNIWVREIVNVLKTEFTQLGYSMPSWQVPRHLVKLWSVFDERAYLILLNWGVITTYDTSRMHSVLHVHPRSITDTLIDMAHSLINHGFIKKTKKYVEHYRKNKQENV